MFTKMFERNMVDMRNVPICIYKESFTNKERKTLTKGWLDLQGRSDVE